MPEDSVTGRPEYSFQERSEVVQEILSQIPNWLVRWGMTFLLLILLMLVVMSWIIRYPDVIVSRVNITTENPPVRVVARTSGKLEELFVKENQFVPEGTILGVIENPADFSEVVTLKQKLLALQQVMGSGSPDVDLPRDFAPFLEMEFQPAAVFGPLQSDYSRFLQAIEEYRFHLDRAYHRREKASIQSQIRTQRAMNEQLERQVALLEREAALAEKQFRKDQGLFQNELLSETQRDDSETLFLQKKSNREQARANLLSGQQKLTELDKSLLDIEQRRGETEQRMQLNLVQAFKTLQSRIAAWEQEYLLVAPADGYVSFFEVWSDRQFIQAGDEVMTIVPKSGGELLGKIQLQGPGSGKVKPGQTVRIKFDSFPFHEFGAVEGVVASMSRVSRESGSLIDVRLPNGLLTSYQKELDFTQGMRGNAEIITEDQRLLERIFDKFRYLLTYSEF